MLQQLEKKLTELLNFTPYTYIQKTYNNVLCSIKKISESTSFWILQQWFIIALYLIMDQRINDI